MAQTSHGNGSLSGGGESCQPLVFRGGEGLGTVEGYIMMVTRMTFFRGLSLINSAAFMSSNV